MSEPVQGNIVEEEKEVNEEEPNLDITSSQNQTSSESEEEEGCSLCDYEFDRCYIMCCGGRFAIRKHDDCESNSDCESDSDCECC